MAMSLDTALAYLALHWPGLLYASIIIPLTYALLKVLYNLTLHPLASYPGPLLSRAFTFPHAWRIYSGHGPFNVHALHEKYGPVVRIGPNHLSFVDPSAWKDIYSYYPTNSTGGIGHNGNVTNTTSGKKGNIIKENTKSRIFYRDRVVQRNGEDPPHILDADWDEHSRLRKAIQSGFSERAMRAQEPVIQGYVDMLIKGLKRRAERGEEKVDVVKWFNWTTFDIVGDLVFAESFGCLKREAGHPFVDMIVGLVGQMALFTALRYSGLGYLTVVRWVTTVVVQLVAGDAVTGMNRNMGEKLRRRLEVKEERADLFEGLMSKREEWNLDMNQLQANAMVIATAGSETTATLLSGAAFLLAQNPNTLERLKQEVRTSFSNVGDITITSINRLPYLLACLNEALRRHPPGVSNMAREVHKGGEMIAGRFVPEDTMVEIQHYAMNHSSLHWHEPFTYWPERWLNKVDSAGGEAREGRQKDANGDRLEAMQPFNIGPRNCLGRNLAYAEMRLILARFVLQFDWELADESKDWLEKSKAYGLWQKRPLYIHLTPAKRG